MCGARRCPCIERGIGFPGRSWRLDLFHGMWRQRRARMGLIRVGGYTHRTAGWTRRALLQGGAACLGGQVLALFGSYGPSGGDGGFPESGWTCPICAERSACRRRSSSPRKPAGGVGAAGMAWIKAAVLEFLSHEDEDLLAACPPWSGRGVKFRKAPSANSLWRLMPGDCWIGWNSVERTHIFPTIWFQRKCGEARLSVAIIGHVLRFMVNSEAENHRIVEFMRTCIGGLSLCIDEDLLGDSVTRSSGIGKCGRQHRRSSKSLLAGWKFRA
jgi:hypothetical protein